MCTATAAAAPFTICGDAAGKSEGVSSNFHHPSTCPPPIVTAVHAGVAASAAAQVHRIGIATVGVVTVKRQSTVAPATV